VLLVTLEPAGDHRDEDFQDHEVPRIEGRDIMVRHSIH